jgi:hypothetical protein
LCKVKLSRLPLGLWILLRFPVEKGSIVDVNGKRFFLLNQIFCLFEPLESELKEIQLNGLER